MSESHRQQVRRVFMEIADLPGPERAAALTLACAGDEVLRAEVESLLRADAGAGRFMGSPTRAAPSGANTVLDKSGPANAGPPSEREGQMIGRYKLLQPIGEGGFGTVWMAEQREPVKRRVALKVIKLGMDTKQVIARFEAERQALAMMDHPHIAKVLDAGSTESGRPYFVMEYIKGVPILDYCDTEKLDTRARLKLFASVCHAIQHAHQKGIIHRDIKPSNVLVTMHDGVPVPKVIDFGIAKATSSELTQKTLFTEHRQMIGTPAYMSPEQAEMSGLDIDTRSDVYSLGVLLYELLTGTTPFATSDLLDKGFAEMMRVIREVEPQKPSTRISTLGGVGGVGDADKTAQQRLAADHRRLVTILKGDLDWIVMKCLEKDRTRRYETASNLASDIARHLSNEPVTAGPPGAAYKFRKFVKRNRAQVIAGGLLAAALIAGIVGTSAGLVWALQERSRADTEKTRAIESAAAEKLAKEQAQRRLTQIEKASDILGSVFRNLDPREIARKERPLQAILADNLDKAAAELEEESIGDPATVLNVQMKLGQSLLALGESTRAIAVLEKARAGQVAQLGPDDTSALACLNNLAMAYRGAGRYEQAFPLLEQTRALTVAKFGPDEPQTALCLHNLALCYKESGRPAEARPLFEHAAAIRKARLAPNHPDTMSTLDALASTYGELHRFDLALPMLEEVLAAKKNSLGPSHPQTLASINNLASAYRDTGKSDQAVTLLEEAISLSRGTLGTSHPNTQVMMTSLGSAYLRTGQPQKAVPVLEESLSLMKARAPEHPNTLNTQAILGTAYWSVKRLDLSIPTFEENLKLREKVLGRKRPETQFTVANLGVNYRDADRIADAIPLLEEAYASSKSDPDLRFVAPALLDVYSRAGRYQEAAAIIDDALADFRRGKPEDSPAVAGMLAQCGTVVLKTGNFTSAEQFFRDSLAIRATSQPDAWTTFNTRSLLGAALLAQEKPAEAEPLLLGGYQGLKSRESTIPKGAETRIPEALDRLIALYTATNKPDEVTKWRSERAKYPPAPSDAARK